MALPLKTFWLMNRNIDRIMAQSDMRQMSVSMMAQATAEGAQLFRQHLVMESGEMVRLEGSAKSDSPMDAEPDEGAFELLGKMGEQRIGS